jgi:hypothetical protein
MVGNADNTSDLNKPVSSYANSIRLKSTLFATIYRNSHRCNFNDGWWLGNVDNTSDLLFQMLTTKKRFRFKSTIKHQLTGTVSGVIKRWLIRNVDNKWCHKPFQLNSNSIRFKSTIKFNNIFTGTVPPCNFCDGRFRKCRQYKRFGINHVSTQTQTH